VTRPVPPPDADALDLVARSCAGLGDALAEVGRRVRLLSEQIAHDWPDGRGHEWVQRTARLGHELGREAAAAVELGEAYARQAADPSAWGALPPVVGPAARHAGIRLGGTEAQRVDEGRGMRIAQLPDDASTEPN
jgi:hypothetical protein